MLKIFKIILSIIVIVIGIYGIITHNHTVLPYEMFFLGMLMITFSISELGKNRKKGILYIILAAFIFLAVIQDILFR